MSTTDLTERRLTPKQLDALEIIRETDVSCIVAKTRTATTRRTGAYHRLGTSRHPYLAEFSLRTVGSLEERGLVERGALIHYDDHDSYHVRITDAGRVALGDWAAGERAEP